MKIRLLSRIANCKGTVYPHEDTGSPKTPNQWHSSQKKAYSVIYPRPLGSGADVRLGGISSPHENFVEANGSRGDLLLVSPTQPTSHTKASDSNSHLAPVIVVEER